MAEVSPPEIRGSHLSWIGRAPELLGQVAVLSVPGAVHGHLLPPVVVVVVVITARNSSEIHGQKERAEL